MRIGQKKLTVLILLLLLLRARLRKLSDVNVTPYQILPEVHAAYVSFFAFVSADAIKVTNFADLKSYTGLLSGLVNNIGVWSSRTLVHIRLNTSPLD